MDILTLTLLWPVFLPMFYRLNEAKSSPERLDKLLSLHLTPTRVTTQDVRKVPETPVSSSNQHIYRLTLVWECDIGYADHADCRCVFIIIIMVFVEARTTRMC